MTDAERHEVKIALKSITDAIHQIEIETDRQILFDSYMMYKSNRDIVCFKGYNSTYYEMPSQLFMSIPQKRVIIEVTRALTIDFNDYGME